MNQFAYHFSFYDSICVVWLFQWVINSDIWASCSLQGWNKWAQIKDLVYTGLISVAMYWTNTWLCDITLYYIISVCFTQTEATEK